MLPMFLCVYTRENISDCSFYIYDMSKYSMLSGVFLFVTVSLQP